MSSRQSARQALDVDASAMLIYRRDPCAVLFLFSPTCQKGLEPRMGHQVGLSLFMENSMRLTLLPIARAAGYFAGSDGHIYSLRKHGAFLRDTPRRLKESVQSSGRYFFVGIGIAIGRFKHFRVHRLVCEAFHGVPLPGQTASHLDGNWRNNKPMNLAWESMSNNHARKYQHGTHDCGYRNSRAKITKRQLYRIRAMLTDGKTHQSIADRFGLGRVFISKIAAGYRYAFV